MSSNTHPQVNAEDEAARVDTVTDFDAEMRRSLERSWRHDDPTCTAAAIQDAQVWALRGIMHELRRIADYLDSAAKSEP